LVLAALVQLVLAQVLTETSRKTTGWNLDNRKGRKYDGDSDITTWRLKLSAKNKEKEGQVLPEFVLLGYDDSGVANVVDVTYKKAKESDTAVSIPFEKFFSTNPDPQTGLSGLKISPTSFSKNRVEFDVHVTGKWKVNKKSAAVASTANGQFSMDTVWSPNIWENYVPPGTVVSTVTTIPTEQHLLRASHFNGFWM
jgi:hypothetical protein